MILGLILSLKDVILGPIYIIVIFYVCNYINKSQNKNSLLNKYFIKGVLERIIATILFSLIHEFYYGGDTVNYFKNGSQHIWNALFDKPEYYFELVFSSVHSKPYLFKYTSPMPWDLQGSEGLVIRISALLGLITFHTYTLNALLISLFCYSGLWVSFKTIQKKYPDITKELGIAFLFLPSLVFWSSGVLKDPITLGALGWLFWAVYNIFIVPKGIIKASIIGLIMFYLIANLKVYILLSFLPPAILWAFNDHSNKIKNKLLKIILKPFLLGIGLVAAIGGTLLTEGDKQYDVENFSERQQINANYLSKQVQTGSAYDIEIFDGSLPSLIKVAPQAINVSLFRPYLWEVNNPFMLLAALEASFFLILTIRLVYTTGIFKTWKIIITEPIVLFCILFSLIFAFGVGANSGNFGTLVRYKIPLMPFFLAGLYIANYLSKIKQTLFKKT